MSLASNLILSKEKHSISEAVLSLFLAQPILKPGRFKDLLLEGQPFHNRFQSFKVQKAMQLLTNINPGEDIETAIPNFQSSSPQDSGFMFESFLDGAPEFVIKYEQAGDQYVLSIHSMQYGRWIEFIEQAKQFLTSICRFQSNLYARTIALSYVDQFNWIGDRKLTMDMLFKPQNDYIPKSVMDSVDEWTYTFGHKILYNNTEVFEHINLSIRKIAQNNLLITLAHNSAKGFSETELEVNEVFINESLVPEATVMHTLNKEFFRNCLQDEILTMVGLN